MSPRNLIRSALLLYLVFPFLFLIFQFNITVWPEWRELVWAFKNSFLQAFFSAFFSLALGIWVALGLICFTEGFRRHYRMVLEVLCLLPNFLPPLFTLLSILNFVDPFPMGIIGIVIAHTVINFGLVGVMLANIIENKIGSLAELAYIEGASRWQFLRQAFWPVLKQDLFLLFLFVFAVCFGSFAIPLIVGGGKGTTMEVLIYEKIRLSSNWSEAVVLAVLQSAFIFAVSFFARRGGTTSSERIANLKILRMFSGIGVLLLIMAFCFVGYAQGVVDGFRQISAFYELQSPLIWNFLGSLAIGTSVGLLSFGSLLVIAYCWPKPWFEKFLAGYVAPSTALCCFAFLIMGTNESFWPFIKIPLAFNLLCLASLYRMGWDGVLRGLESQITIARTLGAQAPQIFKEVLLPQISQRAALFAGVAAVWACGDYSVSRILAHRDLSLAMMTETLMSSYRLGMATILSLSLVVCGVICFFIMMGVGRVLSRKSF
ncbi:ABC transporter permease [Bdellovibrio sp. HCB337]|uniref:ABC transporter permease n=1 Tax=Bdellovibrio sp. HCB337 TaxID=3394358 RepID=UPI0039A624AD